MGTGGMANLWWNYGNIPGLVTGNTCTATIASTGLSQSDYNSLHYQQLFMADQQQAQAQELAKFQANPGHYWETPSQRAYNERKRKELEELTRKREVAQEDLMERHKNDPFRQLCNHDFHALLDKFRVLNGTTTA